MTTPAFVRLAGSLALGLACAAASAQQAAAPAAAPAPAAVAPQAPASNPVLMLSKWDQDRIAAAKADPKIYEQAYRHGAKLATFCANCHGSNGVSVRPDVPNLAGQNTVYVLNQLNKFYDGRRKGAFFMEGLVRAMTNEERFAVAVYYTRQEPPSPRPLADAAIGAKGKAVYEQACKRCHGESGAGTERNSHLAAQQPEYLDKAIRQYRENTVRSDEKMFKYMKGLTEADVRALVAYIGAMR